VVWINRVSKRNCLKILFVLVVLGALKTRLVQELVLVDVCFKALRHLELWAYVSLGGRYDKFWTKYLFMLCKVEVRFKLISAVAIMLERRSLALKGLMWHSVFREAVGLRLLVMLCR